MWRDRSAIREGTVPIFAASEHEQDYSVRGDEIQLLSSHQLARAALCHAEERTRLSSECSQLAARAQALDQEVLRYAGWNGCPTSEGPARARAPPSGGAASSAADHLSLAQRAAGLEASAWRQRAQRLAHAAGERGREDLGRPWAGELPAAQRQPHRGAQAPCRRPWPGGGGGALPEPASGTAHASLELAGAGGGAGGPAPGGGHFEDWWHLASAWAAEFGWRGACQRLAGAAAAGERKWARELADLRADSAAGHEHSAASAELQAARWPGLAGPQDSLRRLADDLFSENLSLRRELIRAQVERDAALAGAKDLCGRLWREQGDLVKKHEALEGALRNDSGSTAEFRSEAEAQKDAHEDLQQAMLHGQPRHGPVHAEPSSAASTSCGTGTPTTRQSPSWPWSPSPQQASLPAVSRPTSARSPALPLHVPSASAF